MPATLQDEQLMLRYRDGDLVAFEELYRRHHAGLYRFVAWRSPRADWVDEIVQDSWINLHHARSRYQPEAAFRTYLYQIARNRLLDLLRQHQPVLAAELGSGTDGRDVFDSLADAAQDVVSPDVVLEQKQQHDSLHLALAGLPSEQKEALVLQQFCGMSLEDIAALVAAPVETVKSRLRYAMRKLREGRLSEQR
ncbi:sigma-70 family RNA polymerase sigma factor [Massilia sp. P8910]|uniref:sigma-70 family RNA polymerase sigma factor n=1 Tax=Massilia antarctica TaxID=2765360 RepID=UPI001E3EFC37|nr:sigma-70 family RNA polymerase sigma factor [Massilia antarctica]MCE3604240.1 sigma-70 family RNA polymerase sigma factor [Massilia antarctica]